MLWRWAVAAISCGGWSLKAQIAYFDKIVHLSVKESMASAQGIWIALLYEELERQEWMERTRKGDDTLNSLAKLEEAAAGMGPYQTIVIAHLHAHADALAGQLAAQRSKA